MKTSSRYQLFHRLLDICFWLQLLNFVTVVSRNLGFHDFQTKGVLMGVSIVVNTGSWLALVVLLCVRYFRDEFAEGIWQRAARTMAVWLTLAPPLLFIGLGFFGEAIFEYLGSVKGITPTSSTGDAQLSTASRAQIEFYAYMSVLYMSALIMPIIFAGLFKWYRWRTT